MKFLIADDHALVRKGLVQMLREEFPSAELTEVAGGNEVLEEVRNQKWDVILLDIAMRGRNGIEVLKQIRANGIKTPILIISMYPEELYAVRVIKAGASGFVNKESANEELLAAVRKVLLGRKYISSSIADKLTETMGDCGGKPAFEFLTDREMQVLQHIASGKTVSEIAKEMSLSVKTISTHRSNILKKLSLNNNAALIRYSLDHGLA